MARAPSAAQRAVQVTFILKGHLKNVQISFVRAAVLLAKVRDEKLWEALRHRDMEDYAAKRLGQQRSTLYHYLQIHDWLREFHPSWLAAKPKGFIPDLSDASALMWIERTLRDGRPGDELRKELEKLRKKALAGSLTRVEYRALRSRLRGSSAPLRALLGRVRSLRRALEETPRVPPAARAGIDEALRALEQAVGSSERVAFLAGERATALARIERAGRIAVA